MPYRHYKGGRYEVIARATHSESKEELVVYRSLEDGQVWARPAGMFCGLVRVDGRTQQRFAYELPEETE